MTGADVWKIDFCDFGDVGNVMAIDNHSFMLDAIYLFSLQPARRLHSHLLLQQIDFDFRESLQSYEDGNCTIFSLASLNKP